MAQAKVKVVAVLAAVVEVLVVEVRVLERVWAELETAIEAQHWESGR